MIINQTNTCSGILLQNVFLKVSLGLMFQFYCSIVRRLNAIVCCYKHDQCLVNMKCHTVLYHHMITCHLILNYNLEFRLILDGIISYDADIKIRWILCKIIYSLCDISQVENGSYVNLLPTCWHYYKHLIFL